MQNHSQPLQRLGGPPLTSCCGPLLQCARSSGYRLPRCVKGDRPRTLLHEGYHCLGSECGCRCTSGRAGDSGATGRVTVAKESSGCNKMGERIGLMANGDAASTARHLRMCYGACLSARYPEKESRVHGAGSVWRCIHPVLQCVWAHCCGMQLAPSEASGPLARTQRGRMMPC